jgi:hypothetical protein
VAVRLRRLLDGAEEASRPTAGRGDEALPPGEMPGLLDPRDLSVPVAQAFGPAQEAS